MEKLVRDVIVNLIANLLAAAVVYLLGVAFSVFDPNEALVALSTAGLMGVGLGALIAFFTRYERGWGTWVYWFLAVLYLILSPRIVGVGLPALRDSALSAQAPIFGSVCAAFFVVTLYMGRQSTAGIRRDYFDRVRAAHHRRLRQLREWEREDREATAWPGHVDGGQHRDEIGVGDRSEQD